MVLTYHLQNEHGTLRLWHKEIIRGSTEKEEPKTNTNIQVKHKNYLMFKNSLINIWFINPKKLI